MSIAQVSFAAAIGLAMVGTYFALTPPNDTSSSSSLDEVSASEPRVPSGGDTIRRFKLTSKHTAKFTMLPLLFAAVYTSLLALFYDEENHSIPAWLLRHGDENGLNRDLITWSPQTAIPLALILFVGVPLRLHAYTSLGTNFTFDLTRPNALATTGIYRYVQHPSYTALVAILIGQAALLVRPDGAVACCLFPPEWYPAVRVLGLWIVTPLGAAMVISGVWTRVRQEERMLRGYFGQEWEVWHSNTPRFLPWSLPFIVRTPAGFRIKDFEMRTFSVRH